MELILMAADLGFNGNHYIASGVSSVQATIIPAGVERSIGVMTSVYVKDPSDPGLADDPGIPSPATSRSLEACFPLGTEMRMEVPARRASPNRVAGVPETVAQNPASDTGRYLAIALAHTRAEAKAAGAPNSDARMIVQALRNGAGNW